MAESEKYLSPEQHRAMVNQKQSQSNYTKLVTIVIVVLVALAVGFFGGIQYQKDHQKTVTSSNGGSTAGFGGGGRGFGGQRPTFGQVTAISTSSITVQAQSGTSTTLAITSSTTISDNGQSVTTSDISDGDTVAVIASTSDATQAARILVNPSFGGGPSSSGSSQSTTN